VITTYDGEDVANVENFDINGTHALGIRRVGEAELLEILLEPGLYDLCLPPNSRRIGEVSYIETFGTVINDANVARAQRYANDVQQEFREVDQTDPTGSCGWILDLRRNTGGDVAAMMAAIGPLMGEGQWWGQRGADGELEWVEYADGSLVGSFRTCTLSALRDNETLVENPYEIIRPNPPIAVLTSVGTASNGEISAWIARNRPEGETRIFGEPTRAIMNDGTISMWLMDRYTVRIPGGINIDLEGNQLPDHIEPDVLIPNDNSVYSVYGTDDDPLLQAALEWLRAQGCNP
jgi:C-terminal processing protease CtpA/Prc